MNKMSNKSIQFFHDYKTLPAPITKLSNCAKAIIKKEKISDLKRINIILCSNYKIRKLNKAYRQIDRPTDVLSFFFGDEDLLGEIYISLQKAKSQAKQFALSYDGEIKRLFIHGFLHLLGYEHSNEEDRKIMESREQCYY